MGHIVDILPTHCLGLVLKELNLTKTEADMIPSHKRHKKLKTNLVIFHNLHTVNIAGL